MIYINHKSFLYKAQSRGIIKGCQMMQNQTKGTLKTFKSRKPDTVILINERFKVSLQYSEKLIYFITLHFILTIGDKISINVIFY